MDFQDPFPIYTAKTNTQAQLLSSLLNQAGIEAHVVEDHSQIGLWFGGTLPAIHSPRIWVDRRDAEKAADFLRDYEQRSADLDRSASPEDPEGTRIDAACPACGHWNSFPMSQRGTVQTCSECGGYMDVGEEESEFDWSDAEKEVAPTRTRKSGTSPPR